ncbi:MAG: phage portal protein, partial [Alphaproteobacteria bacterium]|nr:phage portal protein [Alphaproteobacteria bacterium]
MDDTNYKGASLSAKEMLSWQPIRHSADAELNGELSTLVARSRDLIRNNGIASGAIQTLVDNVVGNG